MRNLRMQGHRAGERGFSLPEVILAVVLTATVIVATVVALGASARISVRAEESVTLARLVRSQIELIQQAPFNQDPNTYPAISNVPEGFAVTFSWADPGTTYTYPAPDSSTISSVIQKITVDATGDFGSMSMTFYKVEVP